MKVTSNLMREAMTTIGQRLRTLRRQRKWTQQMLGDAIGRHQQEIYRWEKGITRIPAEDLALLARALDVSVMTFFPGDDFPALPLRTHGTLHDALRACAEHAAAMATAMQDVAAHAAEVTGTNGHGASHV